MSKSFRRDVATSVKKDVLLKSRRRCCVCALSGDSDPKQGGIAIIDSVAPPVFDNLVFLCETHHAELDRHPERFAGGNDVKIARTALYNSVDSLGGSEKAESLSSIAYQEKVAALFTERLKTAPHESLTAISAPTYLGRSGIPRQADLGVDLYVAGIRFQIVFEIKRLSRKIHTPEIDAFISSIADIGANKAIYVSNQGFTDAAIRLATQYSIDLYQVDEITWEIKRCGPYEPWRLESGSIKIQ